MRRAGGACSARVCVRGAGPGPPHTDAGGQCPPAARRPDIRHSRDTAAPRARLAVHSVPVSLPRHTSAPTELPSPPSTTHSSHSDANCVVLPNFSVTQCFRTRLLLKKKICVNSNGIVQCEDCGPAGRRFFERRKGWGVRGASGRRAARGRARARCGSAAQPHTRSNRRARWTTSRPPSAARSTTASAGTTTRRTCCAPSRRCCMLRH